MMRDVVVPHDGKSLFISYGNNICASTLDRRVHDGKLKVHTLNYASLVVNGSTYVDESAGGLPWHAEVGVICRAVKETGFKAKNIHNPEEFLEKFQTMERSGAVLYTELRPCAECARRLKLGLRKGDEVYYSFFTNTERQASLNEVSERRDEINFLNRQIAGDVMENFQQAKGVRLVPYQTYEECGEDIDGFIDHIKSLYEDYGLGEFRL